MTWANVAGKSGEGRNLSSGKMAIASAFVMKQEIEKQRMSSQAPYLHTLLKN
jgi:hypothetical protein